MSNKNRTEDQISFAISEIIGTVILLAISVALFSIIYLTLSSSLIIQESPQVNIVGFVDGDNLILEHLGGSSLDSSIEFLFTIGGQQQTFSLDSIEFSDTNLNERWDIGERVNYSSSQIGGLYSVVASVRDRTSNTLLYNGLLKEGINDDQGDQENQTRPEENQSMSIWYFNENTGSIANDSVGGNDGTIIGPTWTTGVNGSALYFDGVNDYVEVEDNLTLNPIELTLMAWIKHGSTSDHRAIIDKRDDVEDGYNLYISPSGNAWIRINDNTLAGSSDIDDDVWHHIVGTYDGSTLKIYVD